MTHNAADAATPPLDSIPRRLAYARSLAGIGAHKVGEFAGLSPYAVRNIERDENPDRTIESGTATSIARVLGLSTDWLLGGVGDPPDAETVRKAVAKARAEAAKA